MQFLNSATQDGNSKTELVSLSTECSVQFWIVIHPQRTLAHMCAHTQSPLFCALLIKESVKAKNKAVDFILSVLLSEFTCATVHTCMHTHVMYARSFETSEQWVI